MGTFAESKLRDSRQRSMGFIGVSALVHGGVLIGLLVNANLSSPPPTPEGQLLEASLLGAPDAPADEITQATTGASSEVVLADASDVNAVALPKSKVEKSPRAKPEAPKPVAKAPAPVPHDEAPLATTEDSDVEVKQELQAANEASEETSPEETNAETEPEADTESAPEALSPVIADDPAEENETESADESATATTAQPLPAVEPAQMKPVNAPAAVAAPASAKPATASSLPGTPAVSSSNPVLGRGALIGSPNGSLTAPPGLGSSGSSNGQLVVMDASLRRPLAGNPLPSYPQQDRYMRRQGTTVLIGQVGLNGQLKNVRIENSSGSQLMDRASLEAFSKWRFVPGPEALVRKTFRFALTGDEKVMPARLGRR